MNYIRTLRNHWKKSIFAFSLSAYGVSYLKSQYEITKHMRMVCNEVNCNANNKLGTQPKNVLVIINPVANKKKAEKMFKKYCEPILHLAGYSVEIVKTDHVGHAKTLIENITTLPDAIVVAGGDGTSSEVVTGLMRRNKPICPIALLPLGRNSDTAFKYIDVEPRSELNYVKSLTNSIMPMINENIRHEHVIKYDVVEENASDATTKHHKSIYGLNRFSWGLLKDIEALKDKYWYFGPMRYYAAAFLNSFSKSLNWRFSTDFEYTPPCPGCRSCSAKHIPNASKFYLNKLLPSPMKSKDDFKSNQHVLNENCNTQLQGHTNANQLNIACKQNSELFFELESKFINSLDPGIEFIKSIPKVVQNEINPSMVLRSRTIQLFPTATDEAQTFYYIDGEEYDVRPIKIELVPNAVKLFCK